MTGECPALLPRGRVREREGENMIVPWSLTRLLVDTA